MSIATDRVMTQGSVNSMDSVVNQRSMNWYMVNYGMGDFRDFSWDFHNFFHSGKVSHSRCHKGNVVKERLNMVKGRLMFGEVLIGWSW